MKLTRNDLILLAAKKLANPFTEEQLVVAAWQLDKEKFGLAGYHGFYPNNNLVKLQLMGKNGLVKRGEIIRLKVGLYCLKGMGPGRSSRSV
jgi:hypothetical protein